ncbi:kelch-like protein 20 isoform X1 [Coregonus clupeaformis]|uniref:Kelch-like protein 20 n=2 Tax=Coregonus TaxID=27772 RepID=A0AAN8M7I9_9TELE|nr:kelch-like protein 20 isoform X1 [Coregonus clupeaformis]
MGVYNEQGEALGEPDTQEVMMHKDRRGGVGGRHGIPSSMSLRRQHSKLPPREVFNDIMYIVGGWTQEDPSCPVEQFCPLENEWKNMASMINHRGNVAVCGLYGKIYTVGGSDGVTYKSNVERYDPQTNTWSNDVAPLSSPRSGVCLVEMDGYLYALGGYDGMVCTNTVERYNPKMNSWTKQAPMLSRRSGAAAAVMDGLLYVIGGSDGDVPMNTVERFNPLDGTWYVCPPMLTARENAGCCVYLGRLFVTGGRDDLNLELSTAEKFDPDALRWTPVKHMRCKRNNMSLMVFNGSLLAVGGFDGITNLKTIEVYNHESNTWRHFGSMKTKHPGGHVAILTTKHGYSL